MSTKPEPQMDSCMVICPYCLYQYQAESEDFDQDEREEECGGCGRKYILFDEVKITHHTRPIKEDGQ